MNFNNAATFVDETIGIVDVRFKQQGTYSFKMKQKLLKEVEVGDLVVVDTKFGIEIGTVVCIKTVDDIDLDADYDYKWAFQKVDRTSLETLRDQDKRVTDFLNRQRRRSVRSKIAEMLQFSESDVNLLKELTNQEGGGMENESIIG